MRNKHTASESIHGQQISSQLHPIRVTDLGGRSQRPVIEFGNQETLFSSRIVFVIGQQLGTPLVQCLGASARRYGVRLGGIETGTFVLASAGLLDGYRATIHWENLEGFIETFPKVRISKTLFEVDRSRFSAAGASAALDLMLYFIEEQHGAGIATAVADGFVYRRAREGQSQQRSDARERHNLKHPRLVRILEFLARNLDRYLDVAEMAQAEHISDREVRRLFSAYLNSTPQAYHRSLRLHKAWALLRQTTISVIDISICCGFSSSSSSDFSRAFKREFGLQPVSDRQQVYRADWLHLQPQPLGEVSPESQRPG